VIHSVRLDKLISQCDCALNGNRGVQELSSPFGVFPAAVNSLQSGFESDDGPELISPPSSNDSSSNDTSGDPECELGPVLGNNCVGDESQSISRQLHANCSSECDSVTQLNISTAFSLPLEWPIERPGHGLPYRYALLVDVYVSFVAPTLVPIHDHRNPWLYYPAIALHLSRYEGKHHLLHSLLAHAAFSLNHRFRQRKARTGALYDTNEVGAELVDEVVDDLHEDAMAKLGYKYYSLAATGMRASIQNGSIGCLDLLTTSLSLLLVEVRLVPSCGSLSKYFADISGLILKDGTGKQSILEVPFRRCLEVSSAPVQFAREVLALFCRSVVCHAELPPVESRSSVR
jgi:hypothetical protein